VNATSDEETLRSGPVDVSSVEADVLLGELRAQMFGRSEPTTLGRFELRRLLGRGSHGNVYLADDPKLHRPVAVKLLGAHDSETDRARLLREAQVLAGLNHPNVLTIHDVGLERGRIFVAMEYVEAGTLVRWCELHPPGTRARFFAVVDLAIATARGLAAAHAAGIVHRDVKPANILVGGDGRPRIADFGLARPAVVERHDAVRSIDPADGATDATLTRTGDVVGTPAYMPPEQFGGRADAASDQWSFCASFWEAAYGRRAFVGDSVATLMTAVCAPPSAPPPDRTEVPPWWRAILARGLSRDPAGRWASIAALATELERRRERPRRVLTAVIASTIVTAVAAWGVAASTKPRCDGFDTALADEWNDAHAAEMAARPMQAERMDRFVRRWRAAARQACLDLEAAGELGRGDPLHAESPKMRCLWMARSEFEVVAATASTSLGARDVMESLTLALPDLDRCEHGPYDIVRLGIQAPAIAADLARARTLLIGNEIDEARALIDDVERTLARAPAPRLEAEAHQLRARAHNLVHDRAAELAEYEAALADAEHAGDPLLTAEIWIRMVQSAIALDRADDAEFYLRRAESLAKDRELPPDLQAQVWLARSQTQLARGDLDGAAASLDQALVVAREGVGEGSRRVAQIHFQLAIVHRSAKRVPEAIAALAESARIHALVEGETGVNAIRTRVQLVFDEELAGMISEALAEARAVRTALADAEVSIPIDDRIAIHIGFANLFSRAGFADEAREELARGEALAAQLSADDPQLVMVRLIGAGVALDLDDPAAAISALESIEGKFPDDPLGRQNALSHCVGLASAYARARRLDDAVERAAACEARLGDTISEYDTATSRRMLAEAYEAAGRLDRAREHYRAALELLDRLGDHPDEREDLAARLARLSAQRRETGAR
jgi:tetratricopeptide (TPR) repeat protein